MNLPTPPDDAATPDSAPPDPMEESVLNLLHSFDPGTALHELDLLDESTPDLPPAAPQSA